MITSRDPDFVISLTTHKHVEYVVSGLQMNDMLNSSSMSGITAESAAACLRDRKEPVTLDGNTHTRCKRINRTRKKTD